MMRFSIYNFYGEIIIQPIRRVYWGKYCFKIMETIIFYLNRDLCKITGSSCFNAIPGLLVGF